MKVLEHIFKEVHRKIRVVGMFLNETSASTLPMKAILEEQRGSGD